MRDRQLEDLKADQQVLSLFQSRVILRRESGEWVGRCPFHPDRTPSFHVHDKRGPWLFKCFGCGAKGSVIDFLMKADCLSAGQAIRKVKEHLRVTSEK